MGDSEEGKPEKSSSPARDQNNVPVYPDWAMNPMMQAYYGPRIAVPPYLNSAISSGHAPLPYMWLPPQAMMPPYGGSPYAAYYAHGGVYGHSAIPVAGTACSTETPVKPSENTDGGFMRKLKEFDAITVSTGNGNADSGEHGRDHRLSDSEQTGGSSDGSEAEAGQSSKKRSREGSLDSGSGDGTRKKSSVAPSDKVKRETEKTETINPTHSLAETANTMLELKDSAHVLQPSNPNEVWFQHERELKWERRKQSNRESARRSRLRKQAEAEELAAKVQTLTTENITLKSEMNKLKESSEKLKRENVALMEKLQDDQTGEVKVPEMDNLGLKPVGTKNLLSRVDDDDSADRKDEDGEPLENKGSPVAKLHQLLDSSPRTDVVAAR